MYINNNFFNDNVKTFRNLGIYCVFFFKETKFQSKW